MSSQMRQSVPQSSPGEPSLNTQPAASDAATSGSDRVPLFPESELSESRRRWQDIQASFVDDPRSAVRAADELVASDDAPGPGLCR
jgi:hypothetical protein